MYVCMCIYIYIHTYIHLSLSLSSTLMPRRCLHFIRECIYCLFFTVEALPQVVGFWRPPAQIKRIQNDDLPPFQAFKDNLHESQGQNVALTA